MNPQALLALQLLTKSITDLPLALQTVMQAAADDAADVIGNAVSDAMTDAIADAVDAFQTVFSAGPNTGGPAPSQPKAGPGQRPGTAPAQGSGQDVTRVYVTNSNWASPVPVEIVGGNAGDPKEPKEPKQGGGFGSKGLEALIAKFTAVIGPMALLSAVVGSNISGFAQMGKAVSVLAGTLAPILLPATVLIATALVALSDVVMATLMPGLEGFFGVVLGLGIPAVIMFIDAVQDAATTLTKWAKDLAAAGEEGTDGTADWLHRQAEAIDQMSPQWLKDFLAGPRVREGETELTPGGAARLSAGDIESIMASAGATAAPTSGPAARTTSQIVMDALRDVMGSLRLSAGPRANISGIEGVGRAANLAALNNDPLEARIARNTEGILRLMERVVVRIERENAHGAYEPGDFSDDDGAGGSF